MKKHVTRKFLNSNYKHVFNCYQFYLTPVMHGIDPVYYNAGVYGWNFDAYVNYENDIVITTGYRNTTGKKIPYEMIEKYGKTAQNILDFYHYDESENMKNALENLRKEFFADILKL